MGEYPGRLRSSATLFLSLSQGSNSAVRVRWLAEVSTRNRCSPHGMWVSQPPELPLILTHQPPPATFTLGRVSWTEVAHSRHSRRAAPLGKTLAPGLYSNLHCYSVCPRRSLCSGDPGPYLNSWLVLLSGLPTRLQQSAVSQPSPFLALL